MKKIRFPFNKTKKAKREQTSTECLSEKENERATSTPEKEKIEPTQPTKRTKIFNLIIVDQSGSMNCIREATVAGINEVLSSIWEAQRDHADVQEHYITLVTFNSIGTHESCVKTIIDAERMTEIMNFHDYYPSGCTPLYDAMGESLTKLRDKIGNDEDATGVVTVLTDGMENASQHWKADTLRKLIEQLKEMGWTFSYMGSDHDVREVTDLLAIDNVVEFSHDARGASNTWTREHSSRKAFYDKMARDYDACARLEEKRALLRRFNMEYYCERITPMHVNAVALYEVFVFGSTVEGNHTRGAALHAMNLGAKMGVSEGLQGQTYAIPTTGGIRLLGEAVERFIRFAEEHRELKFLVTKVGCGMAGYSPAVIAPLFRDALRLENVSLPAEFWELYGLKSHASK